MYKWDEISYSKEGFTIAVCLTLTDWSLGRITPGRPGVNTIPCAVYSVLGEADRDINLPQPQLDIPLDASEQCSVVWCSCAPFIAVYSMLGEGEGEGMNVKVWWLKVLSSWKGPPRDVTALHTFPRFVHSHTLATSWNAMKCPILQLTSRSQTLHGILCSFTTNGVMKLTLKKSSASDSTFVYINGGCR